jgi:hypothetical protein
MIIAQPLPTSRMRATFLALAGKNSRLVQQLIETASSCRAP